MIFLAGACDGAVALDGCGFSKWDARFGRELARSPEWTPRETEIAIKLVAKYRGQLPADLIAKAKGD